VDEEPDRLAAACAAMEAALQMQGAERHLLMDQALKLWSAARGASAATPPAAPADTAIDPQPLSPSAP